MPQKATKQQLQTWMKNPKQRYKLLRYLRARLESVTKKNKDRIRSGDSDEKVSKLKRIVKSRKK